MRCSVECAQHILLKRDRIVARGGVGGINRFAQGATGVTCTIIAVTNSCHYKHRVEFKGSDVHMTAETAWKGRAGPLSGSRRSRDRIIARVNRRAPGQQRNYPRLAAKVLQKSEIKRHRVRIRLVSRDPTGTAGGIADKIMTKTVNRSKYIGSDRARSAARLAVLPAIIVFRIFGRPPESESCVDSPPSAKLAPILTVTELPLRVQLVSVRAFVTNVSVIDPPPAARTVPLLEAEAPIAEFPLSVQLVMSSVPTL